MKTQTGTYQLIRLLVLSGGAIIVGNLSGKSIDTSTIIRITLQAGKSCSDYKITGICLWLHCRGPVCRIQTSPRITHYLPDVVVSVYATASGNPWNEMATAGRQQRYKGGTVTQPGNPLTASFSLQFKFADVIGSPIAGKTVFRSGKFSCQSATVSFKPYFLSSYDAFGWIHGIPERLFPQSYIPGLREVGQFPANSWGSVYPRTGFIANGEEPKRAAVIAQRAGDIVTRRWQPHVYIPLPGCRGHGCISPGALQVNDPASGRWQMLSPLAEKKCAGFGINDAMRTKSWAANRSDNRRQYAWNLWRQYTCCVPRRAIYIGHIP